MHIIAIIYNHIKAERSSSEGRGQGAWGEEALFPSIAMKGPASVKWLHVYGGTGSCVAWEGATHGSL